jgi:hypothetical protein
MNKFFAALVAIFVAAPALAGTYTPTATAVAHAQVNSVSVAKYYSVDGIVHIAGKLNLASDDNFALTKVRLSLPVSSALTSADDCHGVLGESENFNVGTVSADAANDEIEISFMSSLSAIDFSLPLDVKFTVDCEIKE